MDSILERISGAPVQRPISQPLVRAAQQLEAAFLAEMLRASGFGRNESTFDSGNGQDQFLSFLIDKQAEALAQGGGIGIAESIFQALSRGTGEPRARD